MRIGCRRVCGWPDTPAGVRPQRVAAGQLVAEPGHVAVLVDAVEPQRHFGQLNGDRPSGPASSSDAPFAATSSCQRLIVSLMLPAKISDRWWWL